MIINTRVQDLLLLLWKRKFLILVVTLLIGLASVPTAQAQYEYVLQNYEKSITRATTPSNQVVEDTPIEEPLSNISAFVTISPEDGMRDIPGNDFISILYSSQARYSAKLNAIVMLQMENDIKSHMYLDRIIDSAIISYYDGLDIIIISIEAAPEGVFKTVIECLLQETKKLPGFNLKYSLSVTFDAVPLYVFDIEPVVDSVNNYMTLPPRPDSYIRIIGTALVFGFAIICVIVLIADFVRPVIKGARDAKNNFQFTTTNLKEINEITCDKTYALIPVGKIRRWKKHLADFEKSGISISESAQAELVVICAKAFSTSYESVAKALQGTSNHNTVLLVF